jgi:hypothetical protein
MSIILINNYTMEHIPILTEASIKIISLIKHINSLWSSPNVRSRLNKATLIKLRNFFAESPLILADIAILIKHHELADTDSIKNVIMDVNQLNTFALNIVDDVRDIINKN